MKPFLASALAAVALSLSGCSGSTGFNGEVEVDDDYFDPEEVTIDAGTELHFEVEESAQHTHTVTIHKVGDPTTTLLKDASVEAGDDEHFEFASQGTYHVWCKLHGGMTSGMHMLVTVE